MLGNLLHEGFTKNISKHYRGFHLLLEKLMDGVIALTSVLVSSDKNSSAVRTLHNAIITACGCISAPNSPWYAGHATYQAGLLSLGSWFLNKELAPQLQTAIPNYHVTTTTTTSKIHRPEAASTAPPSKQKTMPVRNPPAPEKKAKAKPLDINKLIGKINNITGVITLKEVIYQNAIQDHLLASPEDAALIMEKLPTDMQNVSFYCYVEHFLKSDIVFKSILKSIKTRYNTIVESYQIRKAMYDWAMTSNLPVFRSKMDKLHTSWKWRSIDDLKAFLLLNNHTKEKIASIISTILASVPKYSVDAVDTYAPILLVCMQHCKIDFTKVSQIKKDGQLTFPQLQHTTNADINYMLQLTMVTMCSLFHRSFTEYQLIEAAMHVASKQFLSSSNLIKSAMVVLASRISHHADNDIHLSPDHLPAVTTILKKLSNGYYTMYSDYLRDVHLGNPIKATQTNTTPLVVEPKTMILPSGEFKEKIRTILESFDKLMLLYEHANLQHKENIENKYVAFCTSDSGLKDTVVAAYDNILQPLTKADKQWFDQWACYKYSPWYTNDIAFSVLSMSSRVRNLKPYGMTVALRGAICVANSLVSEGLHNLAKSVIRQVMPELSGLISASERDTIESIGKHVNISTDLPSPTTRVLQYGENSPLLTIIYNTTGDTKKYLARIAVTYNASGNTLPEPVKVVTADISMPSLMKEVRDLDGKFYIIVSKVDVPDNFRDSHNISKSIAEHIVSYMEYVAKAVPLTNSNVADPTVNLLRSLPLECNNVAVAILFKVHVSQPLIDMLSIFHEIHESPTFRSLAYSSTNVHGFSVFPPIVVSESGEITPQVSANIVKSSYDNALSIFSKQHAIWSDILQGQRKTVANVYLLHDGGPEWEIVKQLASTINQTLSHKNSGTALFRYSQMTLYDMMIAKKLPRGHRYFYAIVVDSWEDWKRVLSERQTLMSEQTGKEFSKDLETVFITPLVVVKNAMADPTPSTILENQPRFGIVIAPPVFIPLNSGLTDDILSKLLIAAQ